MRINITSNSGNNTSNDNNVILSPNIILRIPPMANYQRLNPVQVIQREMSDLQLESSCINDNNDIPTTLMMSEIDKDDKNIWNNLINSTIYSRYHIQKSKNRNALNDRSESDARDMNMRDRLLNLVSAQRDLLLRRRNELQSLQRNSSSLIQRVLDENNGFNINENNSDNNLASPGSVFANISPDLQHPRFITASGLSFADILANPNVQLLRGLTSDRSSTMNNSAEQSILRRLEQLQLLGPNDIINHMRSTTNNGTDSSSANESLLRDRFEAWRNRTTE